MLTLIFFKLAALKYEGALETLQSLPHDVLQEFKELIKRYVISTIKYIFLGKELVTDDFFASVFKDACISHTVHDHTHVDLEKIGMSNPSPIDWNRLQS